VVAGESRSIGPSDRPLVNTLLSSPQWFNAEVVDVRRKEGRVLIKDCEPVSHGWGPPPRRDRWMDLSGGEICPRFVHGHEPELESECTLEGSNGIKSSIHNHNYNVQPLYDKERRVMPPREWGSSMADGRCLG
jgi:hypothetical protein